ncbi:heavy metal translocating P-type ATPase, partial [Massilia arenosa]
LLARLAARAGQGKPQLALWADQVAGWFVLALLVLAGAVWAFWHWHDAARAWPIAVAVLVVSCPCALSLAMPTALAAATDTLLRKGVLVMQPHVLETLQRATHIVFDKTGTLTEGRPTIGATASFSGVTGVQALSLAAALEQASAHPLAYAFVSAAPDGLPAAYATRHVAGMGVEGEINGTAYRLGSRAFVEALAGPCPSQEEGGVWLGRPGAWLARFTLEDALRSDAAAVIRRFRAMGKELVLLSGDADDAVQRTAHALGIEHAYANRLPGEKLALVQQLQAQGAVVAMVGDGINDAAVLQAADVSFAMGSGAALAQTHADCVLMSGRLSALADAASMGRRSARVIRQNLAWATLYNAVAIPAAAFGLLTPWMSGLGMSLSSAAVVINALRLRRG